jgi:hypothetical protein
LFSDKAAKSAKKSEGYVFNVDAKQYDMGLFLVRN